MFSVDSKTEHLFNVILEKLIKCSFTGYIEKLNKLEIAYGHNISEKC